MSKPDYLTAIFKIESLLIKQNQDAAKTDGINGLINFYDINKNMSFLN